MSLLFFDQTSSIVFEKDNLLILYNTSNHKTLCFSRGIDYIRQFLQKLHLGINNDISSLSSEEAVLINFLYKYKFLTFNNTTSLQDNIKLEKYFFNKKSRISLYLLISQSCNMKCIYCLMSDKNYRTDSYMSYEVAIKSIDRFTDLVKKNGTLQIVFFGGEPMLNFDLALKVIDYCENKLKQESLIKYHYHFTTNLSFLPKNFFNKIKHVKCSFLIDIDGFELEHNKCRPLVNGQGSYNSILNNLKLFQLNNLSYSIRTTVNAINVNNLFDVAWHFKNLGAKSIALPIMNPINSDGELLPKNLLPDPIIYAQQLLKILNNPPFPLKRIQPLFNIYDRIYNTSKYPFACGMPRGSTPIVDNNGDIFPCLYYIRDSYKLGNVLNNDLFSNFTNVSPLIVSKNLNSLPRCSTCNIKFICRGGCPVKFDILENANSEFVNLLYNFSCVPNKTIVEEILYQRAFNKIKKVKQQEWL